MFRQQWVAFNTILYKEVHRALRLWPQTLIPAAVTTALYFIIFGNIMGPRVGQMHGFPYITFLAPGLIMMSMITNSYSGAVSALFFAKFTKSIEEIIVSPTTNLTMLAGFVCSGLFRGVLIGVVVTAVAMIFTKISLYSFITVIGVVLLSCGIFSLGGVINAIYAKKFDDMAFIPNFVLTPLTYLGGVFFSISLLPKDWQYIAMLNPIVYIINTFRYGFLGMHDANLMLAFVAMVVFFLVLFLYAYILLRRGVGIKE